MTRSGVGRGGRPLTLALGALALRTVRRAGASAWEACKQRLPSRQEDRRVAVFKARRGRIARCAGPTCGG
jgi:hypothetical protein